MQNTVIFTDQAADHVRTGNGTASIGIGDGAAIVVTSQPADLTVPRYRSGSIGLINGRLAHLTNQTADIGVGAGNIAGGIAVGHRAIADIAN